jgi:hypothetical protein
MRDRRRFHGGLDMPKFFGPSAINVERRPLHERGLGRAPGYLGYRSVLTVRVSELSLVRLSRFARTRTK